MSNVKTINVAKAVQVQIHATEEAIDTALGEAANLMEAYITSRRALRLSAMSSTDVHDNTLKAMQALNEAQRYMTAAHKGLSRIQKHIGIDPALMIPPYDKEDDKKKTSTSRVVPLLVT